MDISWKCNGCGQDLVTDSKYATAKVDCPKCKKTLVVPSSQTFEPENFVFVETGPVAESVSVSPDGRIIASGDCLAQLPKLTFKHPYNRAIQTINLQTHQSQSITQYSSVPAKNPCKTRQFR